ATALRSFMRPSHAWKHAFLSQARSDLSAFRLLVETDKCQRLHHLQMAGEKIAKALSAEAEANRRPAFSHYGFHRWLRSVSFSTQEARLLGFKSQADLRAGLKALRPTAMAIEQLNPKKANDRASAFISSGIWTGSGVNREYPWLEGQTVMSPM